MHFQTLSEIQMIRNSRAIDIFKFKKSGYENRIKKIDYVVQYFYTKR